MKWTGTKPTVPEAAYREAKAIPLVNSRRPPGSVMSVAMKHRCDPALLVPALYRRIKRYEVPR